MAIVCANSVVQYGTKQKVGRALTPRQNVTVPLPPIALAAKVLKIVMFPNGKEVGLPGN